MGTSVKPLLPPGYHFAPTDEELVMHYLRNKVLHNPLPAGVISEIDADDLYSKPPYAIVDDACGERREWYFFIGHEHEQKGNIPMQSVRGGGDTSMFQENERSAKIMMYKDAMFRSEKKIRRVGNEIGFWIAVGRDCLVYDSENTSAFKIHYTYFSGSTSNYKKTQWRMVEYHLIEQNLKKEEWVLGRITRGRDYCSDL